MQLGAALRARNTPLVVLAMAPGPIVAPWAADAAAALAIFLAGQATGEAWARVLLGEISPSGKLPVTFPLREEDARPPCDTSTCVYDDRLHVGWKALIQARTAHCMTNWPLITARTQQLAVI